MFLRRCIASLLLAILPALALAQTAATYSLTPAASEKFVRATQQMVQAGIRPNPQGGGNPLDLSGLQRQIDGDPAAKQALAAAGMTSAEYVAFMGAAMAAMMVGQMEAAGMRGMMPPGLTTRPSQQNIDFMKSNTDIFQRSMTPGAPTAAGSGQPLAAAVNTSDVALPVPAEAGAVLPSSLLARLPRLDAIRKGTDCTLGNMQATIEAETAKARALQSANYGNPGDRGLERTPAEGALLARLDDNELESCATPMSMMEPAAMTAAAEERDRALSRIVEEEQSAWNACPGIAGGKDAACERAVAADTARKSSEVYRRYLAAVAQPFAGQVASMQACSVKREAIVKDAKTANVRGANVQDALRPLVLAWDTLPYVTARWTGICEDAQRYLTQ
jgi:hypothetical protein